MGRKCLVCAHPERAAIDAEVVRGEKDQQIAVRFTVKEGSVGRHRRNGHVPGLPADAVKQARQQGSTTLKLSQRRKRPRLGPFSSKQSLISVDGRCSAARAIRGFANELVRHLGRDPTPLERTIIREASIKNARILMMSETLLDKNAPDVDLVSRCYLAWSNSLRRDLEALGIKAPEQKAPQLSEFLGRRPGRPPKVAA